MVAASIGEAVDRFWIDGVCFYTVLDFLRFERGIAGFLLSIAF